MARPTPKEILELKPHIVEHVYDENGKEIGWIADNFVVQTQKEVDDILKELGRIWGESCAVKPAKSSLPQSPDITASHKKGEIMPNYFGKQRLVRILYNYLEWTAPEKLAELKRELKEAGEYRKYEVKYTKRRGDEWLKAHIYFDRIEYRFEMHAWGKESKRVTLIEKKVIGDYDDESITQTFAGTAHYDENFNPVDTSHCSDLLALQSIAKVGQAS